MYNLHRIHAVPNVQRICLDASFSNEIRTRGGHQGTRDTIRKERPGASGWRFSSLMGKASMLESIPKTSISLGGNATRGL